MFTKKIQGGITMHFDPSYFEAEERNGFHITSMMKRAWAAQLEVLEQIDIICKRHDIMYYAEWGTLLGAIRHRGFIPWDDDIDIGMLRKDYVRFLHYAKKELPEEYNLINVYDHNHDQLIVRINNSKSIRLDNEFLMKYHSCPYVVGIDLFINDYIPKEKSEEELQLSLISSVFCLNRKWDDEELSETEKMNSLHEIEELCNITFTDDKPIKQQLMMLCDRLCAMYWDTDAEEITYMLKLVGNPNYRFPISDFEFTIEVPFENTMMPIPIAYDKVLKMEYGDNYMTPLQGGSSHEYPFYNKQKPELMKFFQENGLEFPKLFE